jgi:hypothetical protein
MGRWQGATRLLVLAEVKRGWGVAGSEAMVE